MISITPVFLLLVQIFVFSREIKNRQMIRWFAIAFIFSFVLEIAGVKTGLVFGQYEYSDVLGVKMFGVPLIIGLNWIFVTAGAIKIADLLKIKNPFLPAFFTVLFDFILEPAAVFLKYWQWENSVIPFQNYAAWYVISLVIVIIFRKMEVKESNILFADFFLAQILFFAGIRIFLWV
ncbi:MAG: carotenoid biosynthesis protein [Ignavibacteria bacterium]|nr:carotenoid biosynthesis protein [Ignavibacteria bacterium]